MGKRYDELAMPPDLDDVIITLRAAYGEMHSQGARGPFEMILWEQAAYLADDARRASVFERLRSEVGTSAMEIAGAPLELLEQILSAGGIYAEVRAQRMQDSAQRVIDMHGGDLATVLPLPFARARRALAAFPMIGEPGAEKILLFTRTHAVLALESNGLRALLRIGYGIEARSYGASYRSAQQAAAGALPADCDVLIEAHLLLRAHGQQLCTRNRPGCGSCPLRARCRFATVGVGE